MSAGVPANDRGQERLNGFNCRKSDSCFLARGERIASSATEGTRREAASERGREMVSFVTALLLTQKTVGQPVQSSMQFVLDHWCRNEVEKQVT